MGTPHITLQVKEKKEIIHMFKQYSTILVCMIAGQLYDGILTAGSFRMCFMFSALHTTAMCLLTQSH